MSTTKKKGTQKPKKTKKPKKTQKNEVLLYSRRGSVGSLVLNRPDSLNAFDSDLRSAMRSKVAEIEDSSVRIVILRGSGSSFCAGADLGDGMADPLSFHLDHEYKPFLDAIAHSDKIWISQVHGACAGIGAALAMNCDLMTMSEDAYIYMAFSAISLVPDGGNTKLLVDAMGYRRALSAALEGRRIYAPECYDIGLCNHVFPPNKLERETRAWANRLSLRAPLSLPATKRLMRSASRMTYGEAITAEGLEQVPLLRSFDFREGVRAFFAKRKPRFKGR